MPYTAVANILLLIFLLSTASFGAFGANKSAVEPQVLSLPKGPGSIEGLGESFAPQLNTGTATYRVDLATPPGVNRHQPGLALVYNSGYGNSPLGLSWRLNVPHIQRQTDKGLPAYTDSDVFIHSEGGELVPLADGTFRLKVEGSFMKFQYLNGGWEVWERNGTHHYFGTTEGARLQTPSGTFEWRLEKSVDTNGNEIVYLYDADPAERQPYLREIRYALASDSVYQSVHFLYEPRPDAFTDYRSRHRILTAKRLAVVEMRSRGALVRKYQLAYQADADLSLLAQIVQYGADGASKLPSLSFGYSGYSPQQFKTVAMSDPPPVSLSNANADLIDIDGDGLPDLIHTDTLYSRHRFYLNQGRGAWRPDGPVSPDTSLPYFLSSQGVMMADMDGDGLADLYVKNPDKAGYFKNPGKPAWNGFVKYNVNPNFSFESSNVRLLDLNNDKLTDVLMDDGYNYRVWLNPKDGLWNPYFDYKTSRYLSLNGSTTRLGDMNGDRMEDLVQVRDGSVYYFPSKGLGEFDDSVVMANSPGGLGTWAYKLELTDLNNDGLADLVLVDYSSIRVWFNAANGGFKPEVRLDGTPPMSTGSAHRFADMNGDGFRDLLITNDSSPDRYQYVEFNQGVHPYLLTRIDNGLGMETTIDYRSSTEDYLDDRDAGRPWTRRLPFPVQVVGRVTVKDKLGGQAYTTDYRYRDGYYEGEKEKEFRGFAEVQKDERGGPTAPGLVSRHLFDVGDIYESRKGMLKSLAFLNEGGSAAPPQGLYEIADHTLTTRTLFDGLDGRNVTFSFTSATRTRIYERGSTPKTLLRKWNQDAYGNVTQDLDYGLVDGTDLAAGHDEILTYVIPRIDAARWIVDRPSRIRKTGLNGEFVSSQRLSYDANGNLLGDERSPDGTRFIPVLRHRYDSYGNIVRTTDANGHWRQFAYDGVFHALPVRETVGDLNLTMSAAYDLGLGAMTSFTDPNGRKTSFRYDTFGRLASLIKPGDSVAYPTQGFEYHLADPVSSIVTRSREEFGQPGTYDTVSYFDGLGRKLQTRSEAEDGKWAVTDAAKFNLRQGVQRRWLPYFADGPDYAPPPLALAHTVFNYDARGRSVRETHSTGGFRSTLYRPLEKVQRDEEDNLTGGRHYDTPLTYVSDGRNRLTEVRERNGSDTYSTRYAYDGLDNLTGITDPGGNVKTLRYDGLGRKTSVDDPDRGDVAYQYDDASNLLSTTDAKEQTVAYTYDAANRILTESYQGGVKVRYHYDGDLPADDAGLQNTLGRLAWVEDEAGRETYSYDARGNVFTQARSLNGLRFATGRSYDAMDRLSGLTYPDGSQVDYRYNAMGRLESVPGYVDNIDYLATGQKSAFQYANGVRSRYEYDARQRLGRLFSEGGGGVLQDLNYQYDGVNNIVRIDDQRPLKPPEDRSAEYAYDDLYRLTEATAPAWSERYRYDGIGNMTFKSDLGDMGYGGGGAGPHALTGAAGGAYGYDANGNLASKPGFAYAFDARDRLAHVDRAADGAETDYAYDYLGRRRLKTVGAGGRSETTLYADRHAEMRQDQLVKQVYAGDRLVARTFADPAGERTYFYLPDHLGNASLVTDATGATAEESVFYPFGSDRASKGNFWSEYRFTGQEFDRETGLYYLGARYYDAATGRFISTDPLALEKDGALFNNHEHSGEWETEIPPIGITGRIDAYAYVYNSPVNSSDITGECPWCIAAVIGGAVDIGIQLYNNDFNFRELNWKEVALSAAAAGIGIGSVGVAQKFTKGFGLIRRAGAEVKEAPDITIPYKRPSGATTKTQRESVQGKPCVNCGTTTSRQVADHKTPLVKEYYETGSIDIEKMRSIDAVQPQCPTCSARQGAEMSRYSRQQREELGL